MVKVALNPKDKDVTVPKLFIVSYIKRKGVKGHTTRGNVTPADFTGRRSRSHRKNWELIITKFAGRYKSRVTPEQTKRTSVLL